MKKLIAGVSLFALPLVTFAQTITDANSLIAKLAKIGNALIPIAISFAVIWLVIAIVRYIIAGSDDDKEAGKKMVAWGIIGLFLILSIWGLVNILRRTFVTDNSIPTNEFPQVIVPGNI